MLAVARLAEKAASAMRRRDGEKAVRDVTGGGESSSGYCSDCVGMSLRLRLEKEERTNDRAGPYVRLSLHESRGAVALTSERELVRLSLSSSSVLWAKRPTGPAHEQCSNRLGFFSTQPDSRCLSERVCRG